MIRNRILTLICSFAPAVVAAQAPPAPPAPPAAPIPVAPVAPLAPLPPEPPLPFVDIDVSQITSDAIAAAADAARVATDAVESQLGAGIGAGIGAGVGGGLGVRIGNEIASRMQPFALFQRGGRGPNGGSPDNRLYERGQDALDRSQWNEALSSFTDVANRGGSRADGALYWKAYTLNKLGRRDDALAAIAELRKSYASSRWLDDANALEIEIKQASGQNVSPENQPDEELKLMALNALVNSDPDRAIPLLENLLKSTQSLRLKERALFVLATSNAPRAQQLLEQIAKGNGNPDLQLKAIQYLGTMGRKQGRSPMLFDIYNGSSDENVKRAVLRSMLVSADTDELLQVIKSEKSPNLKSDAIRYLAGKPETGDALEGLWGTEQDQQVKRAILDSLTAQRNAKALVDLARKERDTEMKRQIVQRISTMKTKEATDYLMELLK